MTPELEEEIRREFDRLPPIRQVQAELGGLHAWMENVCASDVADRYTNFELATKRIGEILDRVRAANERKPE